MTEPMKSSDNWKFAFLFLIALVIVAANIWAWYFFAGSKPASSIPETGQTQTVASPTGILSPTSLPSPTTNDTAAIKKAIAEKLGKSEDSLEVSVSQNTGQFAKGNVKEKTEMGGGYLLAAKIDGGQWIIVYDGQSQPPCKDLNTYNFPKDLAPECLNTTGQVVKR